VASAASPSLWRVLWRLSRRRLLISGALVLVELVCVFFAAFALAWVVDYLNDVESSSVSAAVAGVASLLVSENDDVIIRRAFDALAVVSPTRPLDA
jgi:hypothetical protein